MGSLFNKVEVFRPATWSLQAYNFIKKRLQYRNFAKFLRRTPLQSICRFCDKFLKKKAFLKLTGKNKTVVRIINRTSCSQTFFKIGVLKNFVIFTGKHLCWSLFLIKLRVFSSSNTGVFLWILRTRAPFLQSTYWWLLLNKDPIIHIIQPGIETLFYILPTKVIFSSE